MKEPCLGPGFGTYNTEAAAQFYSPLYYQYGFDYIWGTQPNNYHTENDFLHDTFYPALAQFGLLGYLLYVLFFIRIWRYSSCFVNMDKYKLFLLVFFIMHIQNVADNSFTGSFGVPLMMILGMLIKDNLLTLKKQ